MNLVGANHKDHFKVFINAHWNSDLVADVSQGSFLSLSTAKERVPPTG